MWHLFRSRWAEYPTFLSDVILKILGLHAKPVGRARRRQQLHPVEAVA